MKEKERRARAQRAGKKRNKMGMKE